MGAGEYTEPSSLVTFQVSQSRDEGMRCRTHYHGGTLVDVVLDGVVRQQRPTPDESVTVDFGVCHGPARPITSRGRNSQ